MRLYPREARLHHLKIPGAATANKCGEYAPTRIPSCLFFTRRRPGSGLLHPNISSTEAKLSYIYISTYNFEATSGNSLPQ